MNWTAKIADITEHASSVSVHLFLESDTGIQISRIYECGSADDLQPGKFVDLAFEELSRFAAVKEAADALSSMININLLETTVENGAVSVVSCAVSEKADAFAESGLMKQIKI